MQTETSVGISISFFALRVPYDVRVRMHYESLIALRAWLVWVIYILPMGNAGVLLLFIDALAQLGTFAFVFSYSPR